MLSKTSILQVCVCIFNTFGVVCTAAAAVPVGTAGVTNLLRGGIIGAEPVSHPAEQVV